MTSARRAYADPHVAGASLGRCDSHAGGSMTSARRAHADPHLTGASPGRCDNHAVNR